MMKTVIKPGFESEPGTPAEYKFIVIRIDNNLASVVTEARPRDTGEPGGVVSWTLQKIDGEWKIAQLVNTWFGLYEED